ncbi:MAG: hypothetical protein ABI639_10065 [Thermoanaerobaculia bacterium]
MHFAAPRSSRQVGARHSLAFAGLVIAATSLPLAAQLSPNGGEFQVNTYTTGDQESAAAASDAQGNFVITWTSFGSPGADTSVSSVQARRYRRTGSPLGAQFQVNTYTMGSQNFSAVASDPQGNFVIVWQSSSWSGPDVGSYSILGQRFDSSGNAVGVEFQVNTYTTDDQRFPKVASDAAGNFVVAWQSLGSGGTDTSSFSIHARRFDANGAPISNELQVNTYTTSEQSAPGVASDALGNFVVTWESYGSAGADQSNWGVLAQRYDANAVALGGEFQVNTYTTGIQRTPAVGSDAQGNFVVAWESGDLSGYGIKAQRFDANGLPLDVQFQVNTYTTNLQRFPVVASDGGSFVVAWESTGSSGTDSSSKSVQAQRYEAGGAPLGGEFQVNSYTTSAQFMPAVASDSHGDFVIAWESLGSTGSDSDSLSIQAQRLDGLFRDDFESAGTLRWSASVP